MATSPLAVLSHHAIHASYCDSHLKSDNTWNNVTDAASCRLRNAMATVASWEEEDLYPDPPGGPSPPAVPGSISQPSHHRRSPPRTAFYSSEPERCRQPCDEFESESEWECVLSAPPTVQRRESPSRFQLVDMGYLTPTGTSDSESDSNSRTHPQASNAAAIGLEGGAANLKAAVTAAGQREKQPTRRRDASSRSAGSTITPPRTADGRTALPPTGRSSSQSSMSAAAAAVKKTRCQTAQQLLSERSSSLSFGARSPGPLTTSTASRNASALAHCQRSRSDTRSAGGSASARSNALPVSARHSHRHWQVVTGVKVTMVADLQVDAGSSVSESSLARATRACEQYLRTLEEHLG